MNKNDYVGHKVRRKVDNMKKNKIRFSMELNKEAAFLQFYPTFTSKKLLDSVWMFGEIVEEE